MQKTSLEKWVDELQAQIDAVNRKVAAIQPPTPIPDPDCFVFSCGHGTMTVTDDPIEGSNDNEFTRTAEYEFAEEFDTENYDYYINFDFFSVDISSAIDYYATTACMALHDDTPFQDDLMPVLSSETSQDTETYAVAGIVTVSFQYGETVTLSVVSGYGDGNCIAGDTGVSTIDYMIVAKKKTEITTKKKKTKNRRK